MEKVQNQYREADGIFSEAMEPIVINLRLDIG
jgi:hypothetical protein